MNKNSKWRSVITVSVLVFFTSFLFIESSAWARAGGGKSGGSRGSRSFSSPSMPSNPSLGSPGMAAPGRTPAPTMPGQNQGGFFSRNPFMAGLAGGLAGGMLGGMLFGGTGHAAVGAGAAKGGIGLLDIAIIGLLLYLAWRFFRRRRTLAFEGADTTRAYSAPDFSAPTQSAYVPANEVEEGYSRLQQTDPYFSVEALKTTFEDIFFRVQAAWMNRTLDGVRNMLTPEMAAYFTGEFEMMRQQGRINRLENIAVRQVEPSEIWQEVGKDYITVLFTANLLDYTVDEQTGQIVGGDKLNPVKFQEFWTFSRDVGSSQWRLAAINQPGEALPHSN